MWWEGGAISQTHYPMEAIDMEVLPPGVWLPPMEDRNCHLILHLGHVVFLSSSCMCVSIFQQPPSSYFLRPASDCLLSLTLCRPVSSMFSLPVILLRTTVLSSSSVTAPLHILCMLYRQPNGGNQSTQMRLDSVCTLHSNQSSFD